ncbi:MAG: arginine--tRNA ligase [Anaerolineales bacterium]|nr:arginine--tRNA ligase [Anaerolineales bacterium]
MFDQEQKQIEEKIKELLQSHNIPVEEEFKWASIPFSGEWGTSTSFFQTAAQEARSGKQVKVPLRAQEIAEIVRDHFGLPERFSRVEAVRGYLNLYYQTGEFSRRVVDTAVQQGADFGRGQKQNQLVMIEFSQPNTHKAMHVGHMRTMLLGDVVANILEFSGVDVVRANYFGDFGRDVIKWMWNFQKRHAGERPPASNVTRWMGDLYAESTRMLAEDPEGEAEILEMFARWEAKDPEIRDMWRETRQWSLDGFNEIYERFNIRFDQLYYESQMEEFAKDAVLELIESGIAVDERHKGGPVIIKLDELLGLEDETYRVLVLMRSDSTTLYSAWDLVLAKKKFEDYPLDRSIYVVDVRQSLHFKQVFKTLELAGWDKTDKVFHLPYEIVNLPGNVTMSSREGTVVLLEDLIKEAIQRAYEVSLERNPQLDEKTRLEVAEAVGIGAIKYPLLARDNTKLATFDWESALDFNGHAAPYIQYAFVRTNSLLKRAGGPLAESIIPRHELETKEVELIEKISEWPQVVQRAAKEFKTLEITNHAYHLARAFNEFYNTCPVLKADAEVRDFRLRLVAAAQQAIHNSLEVLNIPVPEVM